METARLAPLAMAEAPLHRGNIHLSELLGVSRSIEAKKRLAEAPDFALMLGLTHFDRDLRKNGLGPPAGGGIGAIMKVVKGRFAVLQQEEAIGGTSVCRLWAKGCQ